MNAHQGSQSSAARARERPRAASCARDSLKRPAWPLLVAGLALACNSLLQLAESIDWRDQTPGEISGDPCDLKSLPKRKLEKCIVDDILSEMNYDRRIRPSGINNKTGQDDGPVEVRVNTFIRSISKIDDVTMEYSVQLSLRQEWVDERLAFRRRDKWIQRKEMKSYNVTSITLTEQERLWKPDLFFRNEKDGHFHKIIMPNVLLRINGDGAVLFSIRISLVLACPMDLKYYPLDTQNCTIEMASYGYLDTDLKFTWKQPNPIQINEPLTLPRFTLANKTTDFCTSRTATGAYSCLRIDLIFQREFSYYLIQIYIPCCMLVIVSWVSFWLDPNAIPARVSLGVTTLLTMATQISGINASLPPVSYTKAIDVWTGVCLTFVFGALLEFALVNYASRSDAHARTQLARQEEELRLQEIEYHRRQLAAAAAASANGATTRAAPQHQLLASYGPQNGLPYPQKFSYEPASGKQTPVRTIGAPARPPPATQQQPNANDPQQQLKSLASVNLANGLVQHAGYQLAGGGGGKSKQPCEVHHSLVQPPSRPGGGDKLAREERRPTFFRAWLNKFPSKSKCIDVISRICFPIMFALFNLVYWTTYLCIEEQVVRRS